MTARIEAVAEAVRGDGATAAGEPADARWLLDHGPPGIDRDQVGGLIARLESAD